MVLAKADGDARGGAALSVRSVTGKPIKFIGMGEKIDALEPFHPDRLANRRILGMGDVLTPHRGGGAQGRQEEGQKLARKLAEGQTFDLEDFREQLEQMASMGGITSA